MNDGPKLIRRKSRYERNFTQISNSWLRDSNLSYRARGLLAAVWSHEDGWGITLKDLAAQTPKEGIDAIRSAAEELEEHGYLVRVPKRGVGNQNLGHNWDIRDPHDLGEAALFTALDEPTREVAASDKPTRTALDNPTPIRTPVKTISNSSRDNHREPVDNSVDCLTFGHRRGSDGTTCIRCNVTLHTPGSAS